MQRNAGIRIMVRRISMETAAQHGTIIILMIVVLTTTMILQLQICAALAKDMVRKYFNENNSKFYYTKFQNKMIIVIFN